MLKLPSEIY